MKTETTFFSYSRADSEFVLKLAQDLRQGGAKVWLDQIDIGAGDRWDLSIERALKEANTMLVVLTPDSIASHNVMDEVSYALEKRKKVIPIMLKPCEIPFRMRRLQHIDFTKNYDSGINKILGILVTEENASPEEKVSSNTVEEEQPFNKEKQSKYDKKDNTPSKGSVKIAKESSRKKNKYTGPILITGIIVVLAIVLWGVFIGKKNNPNVADDNQTIIVKDSVEIQDWNKAKESNTLVGYDGYMENYPKGLYTMEAKQSIARIVEENDWDTALSLNTIEGYEKYAEKHPSGLQILQAKEKIVDLGNLSAKERQRQEQAIIDKRKKEADNAINEANLVEARVWADAESANTIVSYQGYQQKYPNGHYYESATNQIEVIKKLNYSKGVFTDTRDGTQYHWIRLKDDKKWMAENLNYLTTSSLCYDNNDNNCNKYGRLYNYIDAQKACPAGWRLPKVGELKTLITAYGGDLAAYKELVEGGPSGFNFKLVGRGESLKYGGDKEFDYMGVLSDLWSNSSGTNQSGMQVGNRMFFYGGKVGVRSYPIETKIPCRCLQD